MRVDDNVGPHPGHIRKGHVDVRPELREHPLLAVPTAELVADDGVAVVPQLDGHLLQLLVHGTADQGDLRCMNK